MTTYFITRHPGAVEWAREHGFGEATCLAHADEEFFRGLKEGDAVIGILPVNLAARVCAAGARFLCLSLDIPPALREQELSAEQMRACGARVEEFVVQARAGLALAGWRLVPEEPTDEMLRAGFLRVVQYHPNTPMRARAVYRYRDMLAAAPQPPKE